VDSFIFLTLTRLVVVFIFVNFSFALFTPPLGDYHDVHGSVARGGEDVVGVVLVLVGWLVDLGAHEDVLPLEVGLREVPDAHLPHPGHGRRAARGGRLLALRLNVDRERQRPRRLPRRDRTSLITG
jgi:hypothetical protein